MLKIAISKRANQVLARMPANVAALIERKIEQYAADPASLANNVKALAGRPEYPLRVGDWRVIFEIKADTMTVLDIGPRGSVYR